MKISLKQLLIAVTIAAMVMAVALRLTDEWRRKMAIRGRLVKDGASWVGFTRDEQGLGASVLFCAAPKRTLLPHDQVNSVEFKLFDIKPASLKQLNQLPELDTLMITSCDLEDSDLTALEDLPPVSNLIIWNATITDQSVDAIADIEGLKQVCLKNTSVTAAGQAKLEKLLPKARIVVKK